MPLLRRIQRRLQVTFAPTAHDRELARWTAAAGETTLRLQYDLTSSSVVLDAGGYQGQWASDLHAMYGCRVEVFEPVAAFADRIRRRFARNPAIRVHAFGLAGRERRERLAVCSEGSSIFRQGAATEEIQLVDILSWLDAEGLAEVDLLKLNIEGGEYEVLERLLDTGAIARVRDVQVQFHRLVPDSPARRDRIRQRLEATHTCTYDFPFLWENWRRRAAS